MNLPTELWIDILKRVVDVPGCRTIHTDLPYKPSPFFEDPRTEALDTSISASIANKLTLLYVCKLWNGILEELLFEIVMIFEVKQLRLLADTLTRDPLRGRFVRRIDVRIRDTISLGTISPETMETILRHCVNLEIFIDRNYTYASVRFRLLDLLTRYATELRHFSFPKYGQTHHTTGDLIKYAPQLTRLEVLFLPDMYNWGEAALTALPSMSFPRLHSLTIEISREWRLLTPSLATWNLPALANVQVVGSGDELVDPTPFFEAHGHRIKVLVIASQSVPPSLERVLGLCSSSLVTLIHTFDIARAFKSAIKHMPKVRLLGIMSPLGDRLIANHFDDLFDVYFGSNHTILPELRELKFVRCERDFELERWSNKRIRLWKKQQARWIQSGVSLGVPGGRLFPGPKD